MSIEIDDKLYDEALLDKLTTSIDNTIGNLIIKHEISPGNMFAVILARIVVISIELGIHEGLKIILDEAQKSLNEAQSAKEANRRKGLH